MKKKLITQNNLGDYLDDNMSEFVVDERMILSPSVLDALKEKGINVVYKKNIENYNLNTNSFRNKVKLLLSREFGIMEEEKVDEIVERVVKKIEGEG